MGSYFYASPKEKTELLVVAGEPSGDRAAARVVSALGSRIDGAFGIGGDGLQATGAELIAHIGELTALGLGDAASKLAGWARGWSRVREEVWRRRPAAALLVDNPEVNLPLARALRSEGIGVVYYVGPQVWAWRANRLALLRDRANVVALVLPFEKPLYDRAGVRSAFVGHPVLDEPPPAPRDVVRQRLEIPPNAQLVALLPGSRRGEIEALAPPMAAAARLLQIGDGVRSVLAPGRVDSGGLIAARTADVAVLPRDLRAIDLLGAADAALVASGTATLEAAVAGTPLAVVYRLGPLSWLAARLLVDVQYIGLPNWIADRRIVPELLQERVTGPTLAKTARELLEPAVRERQLADLALVHSRLGRAGVASRVAALVQELLS